MKFRELGGTNLSPLLKYLPARTGTGRIEATSDQIESVRSILVELGNLTDEKADSIINQIYYVREPYGFIIGSYEDNTNNNSLTL